MSLVDRALGIVLGLLVVCLLLPVLAAWLQAAVPVLTSLLVMLGLARLVWPRRRSRGR
jgi:threonine/homoserine/homoserine lactone efflux protein